MLDKYIHRKEKVTLLLLVMGLAAYIVYSNSSIENILVKLRGYVTSSDNRKIFRDCDEADKNITLQELLSVVPISSTNVFLIWPREKPILLYRYLCSAESWAFHHPNASIWYMFTVDEIEDPGESARKLLNTYPNIKFIYSDVEKLMKDTPLYKLTKQKAWEASHWQGTHMADFLKPAVLWHKGGYSSDTDMYAVRSLNNKRNFISSSTGHIDAALMHYDDHHPYTMAVMETIAKTYNPKSYLSAGPDAAAAAMVKKCGKMYGKAIGKQERNCTIDGQITTFLPENYSPYPLMSAFKPKKSSLYDECVKHGALVINLTQSRTKYVPGRFGSQSILDNIGKKNCPFIYSQAQKHSNFW